MRTLKSMCDIEKLYKEYGPVILNYLKNKLYIPTQDAVDLLQEAVAKALAKIKNLQSDEACKQWFFKIAQNTAIDYLRKKQRQPVIINSGKQANGEKSDADNAFNENLEASIAAGEKMMNDLCIQLCMEKALDEFEKGYPDALCPLLVILSDKKRPIEEIATIIHRTIYETKKLVKQCCRKMKGYKNYGEYEKKHGQKSLCLLIMWLRVMGWTPKEIGEMIGKSEAAILQAVNRCQKRMRSHFEHCKNNCK